MTRLHHEEGAGINTKLLRTSYLLLLRTDALPHIKDSAGTYKLTVTMFRTLGSAKNLEKKQCEGGQGSSLLAEGDSGRQLLFAKAKLSIAIGNLRSQEQWSLGLFCQMKAVI